MFLLCQKWWGRVILEVKSVSDQQKEYQLEISMEDLNTDADEI